MTLASRRQGLVWGKTALHGSGNPNFSGGSYIDDKGYLRMLARGHPHQNKGYVYVHRLVMEEYLGRYLEPHEVIHHINELKLDNRIENFFLTTVPEHSQIHKSGKRKGQDEKTNMRRKTKKRSSNRQRNSSGHFT